MAPIPFAPPRDSLFVLAFSSFSGTPCRVALYFLCRLCSCCCALMLFIR